MDRIVVVAAPRSSAVLCQESWCLDDHWGLARLALDAAMDHRGDAGQFGVGVLDQGKATIVVQADGTFRWTRQILRAKGVTGYVALEGLRFNEVTWSRLPSPGCGCRMPPADVA